MPRVLSLGLGRAAPALAAGVQTGPALPSLGPRNPPGSPSPGRQPADSVLDVPGDSAAETPACTLPGRRLPARHTLRVPFCSSAQGKRPAAAACCSPSVRAELETAGCAAPPHAALVPAVDRTPGSRRPDCKASGRAPWRLPGSPRAAWGWWARAPGCIRTSSSVRLWFAMQTLTDLPPAGSLLKCQEHQLHPRLPWVPGTHIPALSPAASLVGIREELERKQRQMGGGRPSRVSAASPVSCQSHGSWSHPRSDPSGTNTSSPEPPRARHSPPGAADPSPVRSGAKWN